MDDVDHALLLEIRAQLDKLCRAMEAMEGHHKPVTPLRGKDHAAMARILPVLGAHFPGKFATWELVDAASVGDATGANLRLVIGSRSAQQLGQLFGRAAGRDINGITLLRVKRVGEGAQWRCSVTQASLAGDVTAQTVNPFPEGLPCTRLP